MIPEWRSQLPAWLSGLVFILFLPMFGYWSIRMGQEAHWDIRNYHYYNAYAFLHNRLGFDQAPAFINTYLNPFLDLPFYFLLGAVPPRWVGFIVGSLHGAVFGFTFLIAQAVMRRSHRIHAIVLSFICAAVGFYGPGAVGELGTTFHDLTLTPLVLCSFFLLLREAATTNYASPHAPGTYALVISGLLLGAAIGLKYTMAVYAPGLALALFVLCARQALQLRTFLLWSAGLTVGIALTAGYWMYLLARRFGNPFGFFYNGIFQSPYFDPVNWHDSVFFPRTVLQMLFYPFYFRSAGVVSGVPFRDIRFALSYVLLLIVLLSWTYHATRNRPNERRRLRPSIPRTHWMLLAFFVSSYIVWQVQFSVYRYLIPLELLAPLVIYLLLGSLVAKPYTRLLVSSLLFLAIVGTMQPLDWGRVQWRDTFFGTVAPIIRDPSNSIVLMSSDDEPTAFVIPAFPPQVRFVRIEPIWFASPQTRLVQEMKAVVTTHAGPIYLLTDSSAVRNLREPLPGLATRDTCSYDQRGTLLNEYLEGYRLRLERNTCTEVVNNLTRNILFCEVRRAKQ